MKINKQDFLPYIQIARLNRPIGIYLVLWPTLWALWIAAEGVPNLWVLTVFVLGAVLLRSAGCVINDYADRNIDGHVTRTKDRPLVNGSLTPKQALIFFAALCSAAFILVLTTNMLTVLLSLGGLALASIYPFMKRHTHVPQVVLGAAFAWSVPMAFAAQTNSLPSEIWLIYTAVVLWTVAYDTFYAMVDREDDLKIGVKSTAILFAEADTVAIGFLQCTVIVALAMIAQRFELGLYFQLSVLVGAALFIHQQWRARSKKPEACFQAFLDNNWFGMVIFTGLLLDYAFR